MKERHACIFNAEAGLTIRSTIDMLIAETAIENDLLLLEDDNDFKTMSKTVKELKLYRSCRRVDRSASPRTTAKSLELTASLFLLPRPSP